MIEPLPRFEGQAFRFRAGMPSLDLCATVVARHRSPVEQLVTPDDLARWWGQAGLEPALPAVEAGDLAAVRALREFVHQLFQARVADSAFPPEAVAAVNAAASRPVPSPTLSPVGTVKWIASDPLRAGLAAIAREAIDLVTGPLAGRIRACAAEDCSYLFFDTSRPGRRRWCSGGRCGNREHVRQHRARRQAED